MGLLSLGTDSFADGPHTPVAGAIYLAASTDDDDEDDEEEESVDYRDRVREIQGWMHRRNAQRNQGSGLDLPSQAPTESAPYHRYADAGFRHGGRAYRVRLRGIRHHAHRHSRRHAYAHHAGYSHGHSHRRARGVASHRHAYRHGRASTVSRRHVHRHAHSASHGHALRRGHAHHPVQRAVRQRRVAPIARGGSHRHKPASSHHAVRPSHLAKQPGHAKFRAKQGSVHAKPKPGKISNKGKSRR